MEKFATALSAICRHRELKVVASRCFLTGSIFGEIAMTLGNPIGWNAPLWNTPHGGCWDYCSKAAFTLVYTDSYLTELSVLWSKTVAADRVTVNMVKQLATVTGMMRPGCLTILDLIFEIDEMYARLFDDLAFSFLPPTFLALYLGVRNCIVELEDSYEKNFILYGNDEATRRAVGLLPHFSSFYPAIPAEAVVRVQSDHYGEIVRIPRSDD